MWRRGGCPAPFKVNFSSPIEHVEERITTLVRQELPRTPLCSGQGPAFTLVISTSLPTAGNLYPPQNSGGDET